MFLSREAILARRELPRELVSVPEWGGDIYVRTLTGAERDAYECSIYNAGERNMENLRARLCVRSICDDVGKRLFKDDDADALGELSGGALDRVFAVAQRLNKMTQADVEELIKNSGGGLSAASGSNSPSPSTSQSASVSAP